MRKAAIFFIICGVLLLIVGLYKLLLDNTEDKDQLKISILENIPSEFQKVTLRNQNIANKHNITFLAPNSENIDYNRLFMTSDSKLSFIIYSIEKKDFKKEYEEGYSNYKEYELYEGNYLSYDYYLVKGYESEDQYREHLTIIINYNNEYCALNYNLNDLSFSENTIKEIISEIKVEKNNESYLVGRIEGNDLVINLSFDDMGSPISVLLKLDNKNYQEIENGRSNNHSILIKDLANNSEINLEMLPIYLEDYFSGNILKTLNGFDYIKKDNQYIVSLGESFYYIITDNSNQTDVSNFLNFELINE